MASFLILTKKNY